MNKKELAISIIENIGGKENVKGLTHCVTRLRFTLDDESKVKLNELKTLDGVLGVSSSGGQTQVIIGPDVKEVYEEVSNKLLLKHSPEKEGKRKFSIKESLKSGLDTLISCFTPAIPAIAGSGMIKVLVVLLVQIGWLEYGSSTHSILYMIGDAVFYFLPFFVAYNAAKKMEVDVFLAMVLAAIILHPNLLSLGDIHSYVGFFGMGLQVINYSTQALPIIFGVWLLKYVDMIANKASPKLVSVFLRPMISLLVVAPVLLILIGPTAYVVGEWFAVLAVFMMDWGWLAVGINAAIFPLMVLTGTHNATIPFIVQLFTTQGFDPIFLPSGMAANMAQAGAAGAVALKTKSKGMRGTAISASFSALLGITEPALYGVNLRLKKPFIAMIIGAFIGGCYIGIIGLTAPTFVTPMVLTAPIYVGTGVNLLLGLSCVPVVYIITFIITYLIGFEDLTDSNPGLIKSPVEGEIIPLDTVNDQAFSSKAMGDGYAIIPSEGKVISPFDCEVVSIFPTNHAIGLRRVDGLELLIHVGIDTVNLDGSHFHSLVKQGDFVKEGQALLDFDIDAITREGYDITTIIVATNSNEYKKVELKKHGFTKMSEEVLYVK